MLPVVLSAAFSSSSNPRMLVSVSAAGAGAGAAAAVALAVVSAVAAVESDLLSLFAHAAHSAAAPSIARPRVKRVDIRVSNQVFSPGRSGGSCRPRAQVLYERPLEESANDAR